ncbi:MAG TPA: carboxypeptidase-like regulatory domain-containing protein, partial [Anaeromyxobacter sp.]
APAGTNVTLAGADFRGVAVNATTSAGASGTFSFPALAAGSYQVVVSRDAYDTPAPVGVSLSTGQAVALGSLTLAASRGGAAGTVTASGAASQAGTVVIVSGGPDTASAVTDAAGSWVVSGLRVGTGYTATYERPAYASAVSASFGVTSGAVAAVGPATLALSTTGALSGTVGVERGSASGVAAVLTGTDVNGAPVTASTTSAAGGAWSIAGLRQGTYSVTFSKAGYDSASLTGLAVGAGAVTAPGVTLEVSLGTVAGSVSLSPGAIVGFSVGADFSGVVVTLEGADVAVPAAVTDASGAYRFEGVPVSLAGASYTVTASKTWFRSQAVSVVALANATAGAPAMTLPVAAGSLTGVATLTNVPGGGDGLASANVAISITGTAFNGTSFSDAALSAASGAWTSAALPPGTYDILATATGRTCPDYARTVVGSGAPTPAGTVLCLDAIAPSGLVLGAPAVTPPQQDGYTAQTSVTVPIVTPATDATTPSNLRGYELARGASPDWASATLVLVTPAPPTSLTFDGLAADARNVLWARPVDAAGNAGAAVSLEVVQDSQDPAAPSLSTARAVVDSTSATVTISGSEGDANFFGYESATSAVAPTTTCPATTGAAFGATPSSAAVTLTANAKTCFYARAVDRAGRLSAQSVLEVTSDLIPPTSPTIAPLYDPSLLTVHAEYADFFVTAPATDEPAGGGFPWRNVAWVEVDTGAGFRALCPSPACRLGGVYAPCSCGCADARLVCDGTTFEAIRVPLLDGTSNSVGIRAVDLAGNVGSGASQLVATATSLLPVEAGPERDNNPRGRGRLLGYRFTDTFLRLRDLGDDGRPDPSDAACNVGALGGAGGLVPRIAVLGPRVVVHGDGNQILSVRRPGADGLFCSPAGAIDDTELTFYTAPLTVTVRNVTGSFNRARTGEYAAWVERNNSTFVDTVMVQAPNASGVLGAALPAAAALFTTSNVNDVLEGGDCLLSSLSSGSFRVDCKPGGLGNATGVTTFTLPVTARAAALSSDGLLLGWLESSGGAPALHVRSAGADRLFGTPDDGDVTRVASGAVPFAAAMAIEPGHLVVSETLVSGSTYWLIHWSAGPDGIFDAALGADDTVSRVLPSSEPRSNPSILAGGLVAYSVSGLGGNLSDVLASDLSTYRWEAIEAAGFNGLGTNGAGMLFFHRGSNLTARLPDGTEQQGGFAASSFAAAGSNLVTVQTSTVNLRRRSGTAWFGTPTAIYTGAPLAVAAGDRWALVQTNEGGTRYRVSDLSAASPGTTLLPIIPGTTPNTNGFGVSASIVAYQCLTASFNACVHHPGPNGIFGDGDDVMLVVKRPSTGTPYGAFGLAVQGDKIAFSDENGNLTVAGTGPDGVFNTADDTEDTLGPAASGAAGTLTVAGDYAAWLQIPGSDGVQVMVADLSKGTQRQVTTHYSMKERLAIDPSGRLTWIDFGFSAPTIFLYAP